MESFKNIPSKFYTNYVFCLVLKNTSAVQIISAIFESVARLVKIEIRWPVLFQNDTRCDIIYEAILLTLPQSRDINQEWQRREEGYAIAEFPITVK